MRQDQSTLILQAVKDHPGSSAREISATLKTLSVTKKQVNAALYRAEAEGLVSRSDETPPRWTHAESSQQDGASDATWIIDFYLERTGESWTDAQKLAASKGSNVQALQDFSHEELAEAFNSAKGEPSLWSAWLTHARRIRAGSIRL
jgi:DNA-binding transcriptional MocR family regulator